MIQRVLRCLVAVAVVATVVECQAIEMFTYFGDGSRIGLPSLEVPVEAYPGIPLRSDRIRARRRGRQTTAGGRPRGASSGDTITLRTVPADAASGDAVPVAPSPP